MNKHTPGPWAAHYDNKWCKWSVRSANAADLAEAPIYYELAEGIGGHVRGKSFNDYSEVEANARLIATAPDLLEALEAMVFGAGAVAVHHEGERKALQMAVDIALAAIAKARGEA